MVGRTLSVLGLVLVSAIAVRAESPQNRMFPTPDTCFARSYSDEHMASHPAQRVSDIRVSPDFTIAAPMLGLHLSLRLRGVPGGDFSAFAYCENDGPTTLLCGLEGDAGSIVVTPAKQGAIQIEVGRFGVHLENASGFASLERDQGDDRRFLLAPAACP